jgi:hypothetical protein
MTGYIGLVLPYPLTQIIGVTDIEMSGHRQRLENLNVMHSRFVRLRSANAELRRDAFALWAVCTR